MGYELNKLMKQHGVYTPGVAAYSGAAKPVAPTAPAELAKDATDEQRTAYNDLLAKYNADKTKYEASLPDLMKKYEADRANVPLTLLNLDDLASLVVDYYDSFDLDGKSLIPLIRLYWPAE